LKLEKQQEKGVSPKNSKSLVNARIHLEHSISSTDTGIVPLAWVHVEHIIRDHGRILSMWFIGRRNLPKPHTLP
jgi:hypothetical protein